MRRFWTPTVLPLECKCWSRVKELCRLAIFDRFACDLRESTDLGKFFSDCGFSWVVRYTKELALGNVLDRCGGLNRSHRCIPLMSSRPSCTPALLFLAFRLDRHIGYNKRERKGMLSCIVLVHRDRFRNSFAVFYFRFTCTLGITGHEHSSAM